MSEKADRFDRRLEIIRDTLMAGALLGAVALVYANKDTMFLDVRPNHTIPQTPGTAEAAAATPSSTEEVETSTTHAPTTSKPIITSSPSTRVSVTTAHVPTTEIPTTTITTPNTTTSSTIIVTQDTLPTTTNSTTSTSKPTPRKTYTEVQQFGANTFSDYKRAAGIGPYLPIQTVVQVDCLAIGPEEAAPSAHGKWYHIVGPQQWNNYYAAANTFENGDTTGPLSEQPAVDPAVPLC